MCILFSALKLVTNSVALFYEISDKESTGFRKMILPTKQKMHFLALKLCSVKIFFFFNI